MIAEIAGHLTCSVFKYLRQPLRAPARIAREVTFFLLFQEAQMSSSQLFTKPRAIPENLASLRRSRKLTDSSARHEHRILRNLPIQQLCQQAHL